MPSHPNNVIPFPVARLRISEPVAAEIKAPPGPLVDHDGRLYPIQTLFRWLSPAHLADVADEAPYSPQAAWDLVCRRWPSTAATIVAAVGPVDHRSA